MTSQPMPRDSVAPGSTAVQQLEQKRWEVTQDIINQPGRGLADLSEPEFEAGLERVKKTHERMQRIIRESLVKGVHYDNPNGAFPRDILTKPGSGMLIRLCRLTARPVGEPLTVATEEWVSVTAEIALYDSMGRVVGYEIGNCNTRESRFRKRNGRDWTYTDPREKLHECLMMARKRATSAAVLTATGADAFFAHDDLIAEALEGDRPLDTWTTAERQAVYAAAHAAKMNKRDFSALILFELGRTEVGTGAEVQQLLDAIARWKPVPAVPTTTVERPIHRNQPTTADIPDSLRGEDEPDPSPRDTRLASPAQRDLLGRISRSHVFSAEERAQVQGYLADEALTFQDVGTKIDETGALVTARKQAERDARRAAADEDTPERGS